MIPSFKLSILGSRGVGKSTYTRRLLTGEFEERHMTTFPYEGVCDTYFTTNCGIVKLNIWESACSQDFGGMMRDSRHQ
jgi:GTP-binding nuclear protein Ran